MASARHRRVLLLQQLVYAGDPLGLPSLHDRWHEVLRAKVLRDKVPRGQRLLRIKSRDVFQVLVHNARGGQGRRGPCNANR